MTSYSDREVKTLNIKVLFFAVFALLGYAAFWRLSAQHIIDVNEPSINHSVKQTKIKCKKIKRPISWYIQKSGLKNIDESSVEMLRRIITDFNNDGIQDIALNIYPAFQYGHACSWAIFIRKEDGSYNYLGNILLYEGCVYLSRIKPSISRLSFFYQNISSDGDIITYEISDSYIKEVSIKPIQFDDDGNCVLGMNYLKRLNEKLIAETCLLKDYKNGNRLIWEK